jgi:formate/nitrite transporter
MMLMEQAFLPPDAILGATIESGKRKVKLPAWKMLLLGFLAGAYIALAAAGSSMAAFNLLSSPDLYGLGRCLAGAVFGVGLMLVVLCGGELFTGNNLILAGVLDKQIKLGEMLKSWLFVYMGNFIGSTFVAWLVVESGLLGSGGDALGGMTVKIAAGKAGLDFSKALILGLLCNWLVCLAVWMAAGAKSMGGKLAAVFFPVWLFVTSGYEHSVANMFYIPAGIFAKGVPAYEQAAALLGATQSQMASLGIRSMLLNNLLPVTLGNIIGGACLAACAYWAAYHKRPEKQE